MKACADIGTSYSCCSVRLSDGTIRSLPVSTGTSIYGDKYSLPSAVFLTQEGKLELGQAAMNSCLIRPENFCMEFKRMLGQAQTISLGEKIFKPEYFYTQFFLHFRDRMKENYPGETLEYTYITCPVNFNEKQRDLLVSAAQSAGLFQVEILDEPTAAVQSAAVSLVLKDGDIILVYDWGGGTFDVALVEYLQGDFRALTNARGLPHCGGSDMDGLILQNIYRGIEPELLENIRSNDVAYRRFTSQLRDMAVKAKHHLSSHESFSETMLVGQSKVSYTLRREELDNMIAPMVADTITCCRQILQDAGKTEKDISQVLLSGGTSRIPMVQKAVRKLMGDVPVVLADDPELAVSRGPLCRGGNKDAWEALQQGREFEKKNQLGVAFGYYQQAALENIPEAQYRLGMLYRKGFDGMKPDKEQAEQWLRKAAGQGHADAQFELGRICSSEQVDWFDKAARQGHVEAQHRLAFHYESIKNEDLAIYWHTKAAEQDHLESMTRLGKLFDKRKDYANAVKWLLPAAEQGDEEACLLLGNHYRQGLGLKKDLEAARSWYLKSDGADYELGLVCEEEGDYPAAEKYYLEEDWAYGKLALGRLYYQNRIPGKGPADAKPLLLEAREYRAEANFWLGRYYEDGAEGFPDCMEAMTYYWQAESGFVEAKYRYACLLMDGAGKRGGYDYTYGLSLLEEAADQGCIPAMNHWGSYLYDRDRFEEAAPYLQKSAEMGDPEGQCHLSCLYRNASYSGCDEQKGLELLRQSAEAGFPLAQWYMGYDYLGRTGAVPGSENARLGIQWSRKAAAHGSARMQRYLAGYYENGKHVIRDLDEAEKWYRMSAAQGDTYSMEYLAELLKSKDPEEAQLWSGRSNELKSWQHEDVGRADWHRKYGRYENAEHDYKIAADAGYALAAFKLAEFYSLGITGYSGKGTAASYYKKAYELHQWDPESKIRQEAAYRLAVYYEGITFPFSKMKQAREWYTRAAQAGHEKAKQWLNNNKET